jgi:hypothetical protein
MPLMNQVNTEEQTTALLNWARQPAGPDLDDLDKAIIEHEVVSDSVAAECRAELEAAKRSGYSIPR